MASIVRIKRSEVSGNPSTLGQGELAYSALTDNGVNGGDRLYIGMGTETAGNAVNHVVVGGKYFTDAITAATASNTASTLVKRDASGNFTAGLITADLTGNAGTATKWQTARNLSLTGDATATLTSLDGSANISAALTLSTVNTNVGTFGSATTIPVITTNAKGLITGVSTASVASNLNVAGDTGTDAVSLLSDTLTFAGGAGLTSAVTNNVVTFDIDSTVVTLTGNQTLTGKSISGSNNTITNIPNSALTSSALTIGTTNVALGGTASSLAGLTEITVDNININGNTISSNDANGDIILSPNGTGKVDVTNSRITGVSAPVNDNDAANKLYVDTVAAEGLHVQEGVDAATTDTLAIVSGGVVTYSNGVSGVGATLTTTGSFAIIDGINLATIGYGIARVLVKNEVNQANNGIYVLTSNTVLTRDTAFDSDADIQGGDFVFVVEGTINSSTGWVQTATVNVIGTDNIVWQQFSGAGTYSADGGLTLVGNVFAVGQGLGITVNANDVALASTVAGNGLTYTSGVLAVGGTTNRVTVSADAIDIASTYVGQTSITTLGTVTTGTWSATTIAVGKGGTGLTTAASRGIIYGNNGSAMGVTAASTVDGNFLREDATGNPYWSNSIDGGTY